MIMPSDDITIPEKWEKGQAGEGFTRINAPSVYHINSPAAGNYPQSLLKYPSRTGPENAEVFAQSLEWYPKVSKTFDVNTEYTAILTLDPKDGTKSTFKGTLQGDVGGLPSEGVKKISAEIKGESLVIYIAFEKTAAQNAPAQIIFEDNFEGTSLDLTKWNICDNEDRQGRSRWVKEMVSVNGGNLSIKVKRDDSLGKDWIRCGAVQTRKLPHHTGAIIFDNGYGYYEARIKFPLVRGTWGAFWLMTTTMGRIPGKGTGGTEIDIVESIHNEEGRFNSALHWDGYRENHKQMGEFGKSPNIYDGQFHTFAFDWSPSEYVFYVEGKEFWRVSEDGKYSIRLSDYETTTTGNPGIARNPNFIILSTEGSEWAGPLPPDLDEAEMLVDYVRVWNQPQR